MSRRAYPVGGMEIDYRQRKLCGRIPIQRSHNKPGNVVLSLGNPLRGDDGIGSRIIERLKTHPLLPENVTLMDVTTLRPEYLLGMKGKRRILIVDAAEIGRRAGDWIRVEIKADKTSPRPFNKLYSSHDLHLTDIFLMGCILNLWPACIELYAVQSAQYDWGAGLSRQVRKAVPLLCDEIVRQLNSSSRSNVPEGCI